jgi:hypothetical protein
VKGVAEISTSRQALNRAIGLPSISNQFLAIGGQLKFASIRSLMLTSRTP